jgi:hypothetical protein
MLGHEHDGLNTEARDVIEGRDKDYGLEGMIERAQALDLDNLAIAAIGEQLDNSCGNSLTALRYSFQEILIIVIDAKEEEVLDRLNAANALAAIRKYADEDKLSERDLATYCNIMELCEGCAEDMHEPDQEGLTGESSEFGAFISFKREFEDEGKTLRKDISVRDIMNLLKACTLPK